MFSTSKRASRFHVCIATILIAANVFFFTAPKQADAVVTLFLAAIGSAAVTTITGVITSLIIDGIILCAAGVICGSSNNSSSTGCNEVMGAVCQSPTNSCGQNATGEIRCNGYCSAQMPPNYTDDCITGPSNYCGVHAPAQIYCDGTCQTRGPVPADDTCTDFPLGEDALIITPPIVRDGNDVTISWDLGLNYPTNCTLTGPNLGSFSFAASDATGSVDVTVTGPHRYVLECGTASTMEDVRLLPSIEES